MPVGSECFIAHLSPPGIGRMRQRFRLSPRDWLGCDEGAGCGRDAVGGGEDDGGGLLGRIVGASTTRGAEAAGGAKLFCGGRYSGELKRRSGSRGWFKPGAGVMDWPAGRP